MPADTPTALLTAEHVGTLSQLMSPGLVGIELVSVNRVVELEPD